MDLGPHAGFIWAAYALTALVLGGTVLAVLLDGAAQRRALARLAARLPAGGDAGGRGDVQP